MMVYLGTSIEEASEAAQRRAMGLNDRMDPLFDPDIDAIDQRWADRHSRVHAASATTPTNKKGVTRITDAVLSCPCCFTTLCFDCQQ
jgi:hypothetical protein